MKEQISTQLMQREDKREFQPQTYTEVKAKKEEKQTHHRNRLAETFPGQKAPRTFHRLECDEHIYTYVE